MPIGATYPGPRRVEFTSVMFGLDSTSRWVMVDWLRNRTVREVIGVPVLAKKTPVRASETAPSIEKNSVSLLLRTSGATPPSTRTPRMFPARSEMAMMASSDFVAAAARFRTASTSAFEIVLSLNGASVGLGLLT